MESAYSKFIINDNQDDNTYLSLYIGYQMYKFNKNLNTLEADIKLQTLMKYYKNVNNAINKLNLITLHNYINKSSHDISFINLKNVPLRLSSESNIESIENKYYELCTNFVYFYSLDGVDFIIINHQESYIPSDSHNPSFIYNLIIYTTGTTKEFENLIEKSKEHYNKYIDQNQNNDTIIAYTYDDGYWQKTNNKPKRSLKNIYLPKKDKDDIIQLIDNFRSPKSKKRHNILNKSYKCNILLEGKWGAGKTSLVTAIASKYNYSIYSISFNGNMSDVKYQRSYQEIKDNSIIVIEDIDGLASKNRTEKTTTTSGDSNNNISFSGILNTLDGIFSKNGALTFITTNYKSNLDEA